MSSRPHQRRRIIYVYLVSFIAAIGGFLFGYDLIIISCANLFLKSEFGLTETQWGFASSSAMLGCIAGPFSGAWLCDRFGRKGTLTFAAVLLGLSAIGTALPRDITTFNVFRIIGGIGVGLSSVASPMYIAEVAPARLRGRLGLLYQLAIVVGTALAIVIAYFLAKYLPEDVSWRWMFGSEMVAVLVFAAFLSFVPRSPRWLAQVNRNEEALAVLTRIGGAEQAELEIKEINESLSRETGSFSELFQPGVRMALVIGILLGVFSQWTGWGAIAVYMPTLFQMAGFEEKSDAIFQMLIIMGVNILLTLLAIWLVDRVGRRPLWIITSAAMAFAIVLAGMVFHFNVTGILVLLVIFMCAWPHAIGMGALPWLIMPEIQPTRVRAKAMAISTTFLWTAAFVNIMFFPILAELSGKTFGSILGVFLMYAVVCIFSLIFGCRMLPETKNRTLEEIADSWLTVT